MNLGDFIAKYFGGSQRRFAAAAGIDEGQLSRYLKAERGEPGGQRPSADNMARIERATENQIGSAHWAKLRSSPSRPAA